MKKSFITSKPGISESKLGPHTSLLILSLTDTFMTSWASSQENLSSGRPTKRVSNQSPQLQRLARKLKFHMQQVYI